MEARLKLTGTHPQRNRPPHYSRDYRRRRAKADPAYLKTELAWKEKWLTKKLRRCPEYAEVLKLHIRISQLRNRFDYHSKLAAKLERELVQNAERYVALRERCKGK
jgi:Tfp pilus assembly protein PilF